MKTFTIHVNEGGRLTVQAAMITKFTEQTVALQGGKGDVVAVFSVNNIVCIVEEEKASH